MPDVDPIVAALRRHRRDREWSVRYVAELAGLERSTIAGWETGRHAPALSVMRRWAEVLGCELVLLPPQVKSKGGPQ